MTRIVSSWEDYCSVEPVSRETVTALRVYERLLREWSSKLNIVAPKTLTDVWLRHFADSLQLRKLTHQAKVLIDIGSGGGFPGLPLAISAIGSGGVFHLVESDQRKCAFLRAVALETGAKVEIHAARVEELTGKLPVPDVLTARALASLETLLAIAEPYLLSGSICVFPKGRDYARELTSVGHRDNYVIETHESLTSSESKIFTVRAV